MPLGMALLSGAASLVSGLFGRDDAKKQAKKEEKAIRKNNEAMTELANTMNREARARADAAALVPVQRSHQQYDVSRSISRSDVDTDELLRDAERMGVNPISYIRSGAAGMYGITQTDNEAFTESFDCVTGERAMDAAQAGQYIPQLQPVMSQTQVPSIGTVIGNAAVTGVNQYLQDRTIEQNNAHQMALLDRQLQGANSPGAYQGSRSLYVPSATISGPRTVSTDPSKTGAAERNRGYIFSWPKSAPGIDPVTEGDDAALTLDQLTKGFSDWWDQSTFRPSIIPGSPLDEILRGSPPPSGFRYPTRPGQQHRYGPGGSL